MALKTFNTLFFILGPVPTEEDRAAADALAGNVAFRNASLVPEGSAPEKADFVAGAIPEIYKDFPKAKKVAVTKSKEELAAEKAAEKEAAKKEADAKAAAEKEAADKAKAASAPKILN
jgi:hypothetical protein